MTAINYESEDPKIVVVISSILIAVLSFVGNFLAIQSIIGVQKYTINSSLWTAGICLTLYIVYYFVIFKKKNTKTAICAVMSTVLLIIYKYIQCTISATI